MANDKLAAMQGSLASILKQETRPIEKEDSRVDAVLEARLEGRKDELTKEIQEINPQNHSVPELRQQAKGLAKFADELDKRADLYAKGGKKPSKTKKNKKFSTDMVAKYKLSKTELGVFMAFVGGAEKELEGDKLVSALRSAAKEYRKQSTIRLELSKKVESAQSRVKEINQILLSKKGREINLDGETINSLAARSSIKEFLLRERMAEKIDTQFRDSVEKGLS